MAKAELGIKRIDPETGQKFYDLNNDPIISPYTGKKYARSYFESTAHTPTKVEEVEEKEQAEEAVEVVSLEDADAETKGDDLPDLGDDVEIEDEDEDDAFIADEEEEDDDVADIIGVGDDDEEV